ncbi:MAG: hypothetical protein ACJ8ER_07900 [Allosphingosinicella sp.]
MDTARFVAERAARLRPPSAIATLLVVLVFHGAYLLAHGVMIAPDSRAYAYWSQRLIESGFDYPTLLAQADTGFPALLYALFATVVAMLRLIFGAHWGAAVVALNFAAHAGLALLIVRLASRLTGKGVAGWTALALFLACFDLLRWMPFILSDTSFVCLAFIIFTLAARRILGEAKGWTKVLAVAAAGVVYRPTGMVLLPDLAWAIFLSRTWNRLWRRAILLAALAAAIIALALAFAWLMQDPARWPFKPLSGPFRTVAAEYALGEVVSAQTGTYHAPPHALGDFILISADRFAHFFAIGLAGFSLAHWLVELAFFLPCYALAGWMVVALWRGDSGLAAPERKVFLAAIGAVLAYAVFHGLIQVDFDWRYRGPILPHLMLLAAGGAADLVRRLQPR